MTQHTHKPGIQQGAPVTDGGPRFRIELRVSCVGADGGTETPLGHCDDQGNWLPVRLRVDRGTDELNAMELAEWLAAVDLVGESAFESTQAAAASVAQMHQRCVMDK